MANVEELLRQRLAPAFEAVAGSPVDPVLRRSQHSDFQADGALALARRLGRSPREVAAQVVEQAHLDDLCASVEVAGPGFVNLTVKDELLAALLEQIDEDERLGIAPTGTPEVVTVDYSAPNVAKEMHVGHLRSTVIGDAIVRLLEWLGHDVRRFNHLGDWGTPFGMLIEHLLDIGEAEAAHELSVGDLTSFYQAARRKFDDSPEFKDRARNRVVALQGGDETTNRLWRLLVAQSQQYFLAVYGRMDVRLTDADFVGESAYNDALAPLVEELDQLGLLRDSEGARCVFPAGFTGRDGAPQPIIVRNTVGGFGYGATDLATIRYRATELRATRLLYVVGLPQTQHLEMVFQTAREAGWLPASVRAQHVGFGNVLGPDGKMLKTRAGATVKLIDLLDEAVERARTHAPDDPAVARAVGIGAVKYADLSTDRTRDYVFDLDRMLALDGNTAPYLQYAHARVRSIFRRAGIEPPHGRVAITEPAERALALELLAFDPVIRDVERTLEFHRLANHLYGLASTFTTFYEKCPVLKAGEPVRTSRLVLCDLTARTLKLGLNLLGITAPERM